MSKADELLSFFKQHIGKLACAYCGVGSNQTAAIFREVKNRGYSFEESMPNRWGKSMYCDKCNTYTTHYKLLSSDPEFIEQKRYGIDQKNRKRIITLLDGRDAFSGASIKSTPEIDHKTPWTRLEKDFDVSNMSDEEIVASFQLLTREHNLLKDRACDKCKKTNIRPPFLEVSFWYDGDSNYRGSCIGCGWYDGVRWRAEINAVLNK